MERKSWTFYDRKDWGKGAWEKEPDKLQFMDEKTGLPCLLVRNRVGAWCGYVGVSAGHPLYHQHYDHKLAQEIGVHGGLTFADFCAPDEKEHGICHIVEPGEDDRVWWLGFDCSHAGDLNPRMRAQLKGLGLPEIPGEKYRTLEYAEKEVRRLAAQLKEVVA